MLTLRQEQERCDSERSFVQAGKCLSTVVKCSDLKVLSENMHRGGEIKKEKEEDWPGIKQLRRRQIRQSAERKKKKVPLCRPGWIYCTWISLQKPCIKDGSLKASALLRQNIHHSETKYLKMVLLQNDTFMEDQVWKGRRGNPSVSHLLDLEAVQWAAAAY